ncbi:hypothetical protein DL96DRAFT_1824702 [Flagelloscypha sp. PMI_526]|nr:hypothetical protein DL96DRAFT_1824702 [Flagelloscypha sp. PMI_526]
MASWLHMLLPMVSASVVHLITNSTLYPILHEISTKPHLRPEELEHCSETLSKRSKMITNGLLAIIGNSSSPILSTEVKISFIVLAWCQTNRLYYEGLPVHELQRRTRESGPALVATLYAIPEVYQILFIVYKVVYGGWGSIVMIISAVLVQLVLRGAFRWGAYRRSQVGIIPM